MNERKSMHPVVFLDRDGTVNEEMGYINHPDRFIIFPFVAESIRLLKSAGYKVIIITNQSGVARGYFTEELLKTVHQKLQVHLQNEGTGFDALYYCPHHPTEGIAPYRKKCNCRKPAPGMVDKARREFDINMDASIVIGDRYKDVEFGRNLGLRTGMVLTGYGKGEYLYQRNTWKSQPDIIGENLLEIIRKILK